MHIYVERLVSSSSSSSSGMKWHYFSRLDDVPRNNGELARPLRQVPNFFFFSDSTISLFHGFFFLFILKNT
jgi:hypothetical protein